MKGIEKRDSLMAHVDGVFSSRPAERKQSGLGEDDQVGSLCEYLIPPGWNVIDGQLSADGANFGFGSDALADAYDKIPQVFNTEYPLGVNTSIPFILKKACSRMCCSSVLAASDQLSADKSSHSAETVCSNKSTGLRPELFLLWIIGKSHSRRI